MSLEIGTRIFTVCCDLKIGCTDRGCDLTLEVPSSLTPKETCDPEAVDMKVNERPTGSRDEVTLEVFWVLVERVHKDGSCINH